MFSGIIRGIGRIAESDDVGGDRRLTIDLGGLELATLAVGDSIAVNGVCLTVTSCDAGRFCADVSAETLRLTTLGNLDVGASVNLEPALRLGDALDGHFVMGHVDGVGHVRTVTPDARSQRLEFEMPAALAPYVARKGSIAVDGVSLTVNAVSGNRFEVNIVPHTSEMTVISGYRVGTAVNIEIDMIARYLERLATAGGDAGGVDLELLRKHGYTIEG
ncbi:MAG: riboflavin synthase [Gammaproteobacteria bacterium]|nr:riboflavin synthase [Gammaproteobacteria bacterium]